MNGNAAKVIGMTKQEAIDFLHSQGCTVRIASEEGKSNQLQEGYTPGKVDLTIVDGKVTYAEGD